MEYFHPYECNASRDSGPDERAAGGPAVFAPAPQLDGESTVTGFPNIQGRKRKKVRPRRAE